MLINTFVGIPSIPIPLNESASDNFESKARQPKHNTLLFCNVVTASVDWPDHQVTTQWNLWFSLCLFHNKGHIGVVTQLFRQDRMMINLSYSEIKVLSLAFFLTSIPMYYELWQCSTKLTAAVEGQDNQSHHSYTPLILSMGLFHNRSGNDWWLDYSGNSAK